MKKRSQYYSTRRGNVRQVYLVARLWELAANLPVKKIPLDEIQTKRNVWFHRTKPHLANFIKHAKRVEKAKLKYPIILNSKGHIMDGHHRVVKAFLKKRETIKAVQFEVDPSPDFTTPLQKRSVKHPPMPTSTPG